MLIPKCWFHVLVSTPEQLVVKRCLWTHLLEIITDLLRSTYCIVVILFLSNLSLSSLSLFKHTTIHKLTHIHHKKWELSREITILHLVYWGPLCVVYETRLQPCESRPWKGLVSFPGKPGNPGGRHDPTLTRRVPMGIRPEMYILSFEACSA